VRIGKDMMQHGKTRLCKIGGKIDAKDLWAAVRQMTSRQHRTGPIDGITAESLNDHYAALSSDRNYRSQVWKPTTQPSYDPYITEFQVFMILDKQVVLICSQPGSSDLEPQLSTNHTVTICPLPIHMSHVNGNKPAYCPYQKPPPRASRRLTTNIHHSSSTSCHGADRRKTFSVCSLHVTTPHIDIIRPVCLPPYRFPNGCNYQSPQHHHQHATHQP